MESNSRTHIMQVALERFDQFGYVGTSMEAIRKAAGFRTKSSLYAHFPSKESLAAALLERILAEEAAALAPYLKPESEATLDDVLDMAEHLTLWGLMHQTAYRFCFQKWHGDLPHPNHGDVALDETFRWAVRVIDRTQRTATGVRTIAPALLVTACTGLINQIIVSARDLSPDEMKRRALHARQFCRAIVMA